MQFEEAMTLRVAAANKAIEEWLPAQKNLPGDLAEAMRYSVLAGGKRIRPVLMEECYRLFGGSGPEIRPFQAAMEMIHTASLVHDDLPAIDNDFLRRGKKTTHAVYGEALGILAGDALLNYAYEVLLRGVCLAENTKNAAAAAQILADKSGYRGMLGGQGVDVENEKKGIPGDALEILNYVYEKKTSALIEGAMMTGAALAGASDEALGILEKAGRYTGIAFQIQDDILDVTSTTETLGKPVFSDEKNQKETAVSLLGLETASRRVRELTEEALSLTERLPGDTSFLRDLISYLAMRKK